MRNFFNGNFRGRSARFGLAMVIAAAAGPANAFQAGEPGLRREVRLEFAGPARGSRSYLGIAVAEIDAERAKALKLPEDRGVEVTRVEAEGPADKAGVRTGDAVLEYNGERIEGTEQFIRLVRETPVGRKVRLAVSRNGAPQTLTAAIGSRRAPAFEDAIGQLAPIEMPEIPEMPDFPGMFSSRRKGTLGVDAETLQPQLAAYFGVKQGVLVRSVREESPAARAGVKGGDVIVKVDETPVANVGQVARAVRAAEAKHAVSLTIMRERREMSIHATLPGEPRRDAAPGARPVRFAPLKTQAEPAADPPFLEP